MATTGGGAVVVAPTQQQQQQMQTAWPLYEMFLDVPHPAASPHTPPAVVIGAPSNNHSIEQELSKSIPQISRFAFPEFDQDSNPPPPDPAPPLNRHDKYAMQPQAFQDYTFSLTLQSGMRVHGHVRRYLPCHSLAKTRYDVGRRGERALVILTRVTGADVLYSAILKSLEAISSLHAAMPPNVIDVDQPQQSFLRQIYDKHQRLVTDYSAKPQEARNVPVILSVLDLEVGTRNARKFSTVDSTHFLLPPPLLVRTSMGDLVSNSSNTSILPVLRCIGVPHTLRLLCALLSERRVILVSASPTRLTNCAKAAIAILAQGMLHWQHLYIPVLAPHLWQYLAAPYPYLIGILEPLTPRLDRTDGLGEVLIINLDSNSMETRGMTSDIIQERIPDLLRNMSNNEPTYGPSGQPEMSSSELLAQDLVELLKADKKVLYGESALASMQDTAVKATKAVKATFFKLKEKGKKYLSQRSSSYNESDAAQEEEEMPIDPDEVNSMAPDYIYTEGCRNEMGEEEARIAFCAFFLSMVGNMRWYLSANPGQLPQLDRQRFLEQKKALGEGQYSAMWPLLQNFCHTQMLEEFAKHRVEETSTRQPVTRDSPLFLQCSNYHRQHSIDFSLLNVRRVSRQVCQSNPSRMMQMTNARRMAMALTSKRAYEGDYNKALADLVEQCRESSSVLFDVMSVVWIRMRDNKGLQWRHATQSLHIIKNLLFHGPLAAVSEATDGLDKIRALKYYNGNRQTSICVQIRNSANQVFNLLVDRRKLFYIRRVCISKRRTLRLQGQGQLRRDTRLLQLTSVTFQKVHAAMRPGVAPPPAEPMREVVAAAPGYAATPTYAVLPPVSQTQQPPQPRSAPPPQDTGLDLLGITQQPSAVAAQPPVGVNDIFGVFGAGQAAGHQGPASSPANDMMGLFESMTVSVSTGAPAIQSNANPFVMGQPQLSVSAQSLPVHQPQNRSISPVPPQQRSRSQSHDPTTQYNRANSHSPTPPHFQARGNQPQGYGQPPNYGNPGYPVQQQVPVQGNVAPAPYSGGYAPHAGYAQQQQQVPPFAQAPQRLQPPQFAPPPQHQPVFAQPPQHQQMPQFAQPQQQRQGYQPNPYASQQHPGMPNPYPGQGLPGQQPQQGPFF